MKPIRRVAALGLALLVTAGISAVQAAEPPPCAERLSEIRPHPAGTKGTKGNRKAKVKPIPFARAASCLRGPDGFEEPVVLFDVAMPPPFQATVRVMNRHDGILAARIEALDADGALIAGYPFDAFTRRGGMYTLDVFGNDPERPIRWLLVRIDPEAVGRKDSRLVSNSVYMVFPTGGAYTHSFESRQQIEFGDTGLIEVELRPEQPDDD